ncbi:MAG: sulfatase-like hydrolase/transferase [Angelakisella sp.]
MKPNIIIVMTDQQRADLRKGAGYCLDTMPFLDRWAEGGVDFSKAYTANPTCMPARVSMFTGRYPEAHKARTNHNGVDALYTLDLLDILKAEGYTTALCGKNHTHHASEDFDYCAGTGHLNVEGGQNNPPPTKANQEFEEFMHGTRFVDSDIPSPGGVEQQFPYKNVTSAFDFIDNHIGETPFFLWLSFAEPHNPYQVPAPYFDLFPPESLPSVSEGEGSLFDKGPRFAWIKEVWKEVLGEDIDKRTARMRSNYHGMLRLIDDQFARLIGGLEDRKIDDNTVVVFLSDHGDFAGEYGLMRKGPDLPDVLTHIPMIWRGPCVAAQGRTDGCFVNIVDVLPTICDILEVPLPFGCQGKSMLPLLSNHDIPQREYDIAYSESGFSGLFWNKDDKLDVIAEKACPPDRKAFDCLNTWTQSGQVRMVCKGDFKLQMDMLGNGYLYNLCNDPHERVNLWDNTDYIAVKAEILAELSAAMLRACDPIPAPHFRYRVKLHPKGFWFQNYSSEDVGIRDDAPIKFKTRIR